MPDRAAGANAAGRAGIGQRGDDPHRGARRLAAHLARPREWRDQLHRESSGRGDRSERGSTPSDFAGIVAEQPLPPRRDLFVQLGDARFALLQLIGGVRELDDRREVFDAALEVLMRALEGVALLIALQLARRPPHALAARAIRVAKLRALAPVQLVAALFGVVQRVHRVVDVAEAVDIRVRQAEIRIRRLRIERRRLAELLHRRVIALPRLLRLTACLPRASVRSGAAGGLRYSAAAPARSCFPDTG